MEQSEARMAPAWEEVLAQINATSSQLQAFIKHQQNINGKLNCLPKIMQALSEHSDRLMALERSHASIMSGQDDSNVSRFLRDGSASLSKSSHNMLTVSGIPQTITDTPEEVVKKVFSALGVPDMHIHMLSVRRLTKSDNTVAASLQGTNADTQPVRLSYVVALTSGVVRDHTIDKKRVKRHLSVKEVLDLNVNGNIYVNEFLPSRIYSILRQAKASSKQAHYGSVWVWKGRVCVRKVKGEPIIYIDTEEDLAKLIGRAGLRGAAIASRSRSSPAVSSSTTNLRIAQFNANSLLGHIDAFKAYFESHFFYVISICETWLYPLVKDELIELSDYFIIRNDRVGRLGGGVACYVHKSLKVK